MYPGIKLSGGILSEFTPGTLHIIKTRTNTSLTVISMQGLFPLLE